MFYDGGKKKKEKKDHTKMSQASFHKRFLVIKSCLSINTVLLLQSHMKILSPTEAKMEAWSIFHVLPCTVKHNTVKLVGRTKGT